uniref:Uncharacterized protein n=1 Tax=Callorhinchus milii TaxID=7868 RepID=A0A4W3GUZ1_CALMI
FVCVCITLTLTLTQPPNHRWTGLQPLSHEALKIRPQCLPDCTEDLTSALSTNHSLTELNLNNNKLGDCGVKRLCEALRNPECKIQSLLYVTHCASRISAAEYCDTNWCDSVRPQAIVYIKLSKCVRVPACVCVSVYVCVSLCVCPCLCASVCLPVFVSVSVRNICNYPQQCLNDTVPVYQLVVFSHFIQFKTEGNRTISETLNNTKDTKRYRPDSC